MRTTDEVATPESQPTGAPAHRAPAFFGAFPSLGIWTPLGLRRGQFFAILVLSLALFLFVGGPVWNHEHDSHLVRITVSYAVIPFAVAAAFARNRDRRVMVALAASAMIGLIKLVLTAVVLMLIALGS